MDFLLTLFLGLRVSIGIPYFLWTFSRDLILVFSEIFFSVPLKNGAFKHSILGSVSEDVTSCYIRSIPNTADKYRMES